MPNGVVNPAFVPDDKTPNGIRPTIPIVVDDSDDDLEDEDEEQTSESQSLLDSEDKKDSKENKDNKDKHYPWDVFKQSPGDDSNDDREQCIFRASQFLKLVSIPLFFLLILGGLVINKGILLYVTSQMKDEHMVMCHAYKLNNTDKLDFQCVAVSDDHVNSKDLYCIRKGNQEPITGKNNPPIRAEVCNVAQLRWTWCVVLMMCIPYFFSIIRNLWLVCLKKEPDPRRDVLIVSLIVDTLYAIGICILVFSVIPKYDNVLKATVAMNGLALVPAILSLLEFPKCSIRAPFIILINLLCVASQLSAGLLWPIMSAIKEPNDPINWQAPVAMFLVSVGFWENYVPKSWGFRRSVPDEIYKQHNAKRRLSFLESMRACKVKLSLYGNIWKICLTIGSTMMINNQEYSFMDWFTMFTDPSDCGVKNGFDWSNVAEENIKSFYYDWLIIVSITLAVSLAVYFLARAAAKTQIQPATFSLATLCVTPAMLGCLMPMCELWSDDPCKFSTVIPMYSFWSCGANNYDYQQFFVNDLGWMGVLWWLSQAWITRHMWFPQAERLAKSKNIFVQPLIDAIVLDQWLAHNRRRRDENDKLGKELPTRADSFNGQVGRQVSMDESKAAPGHREEEIPHIYMCATMWHENKQEMLQILKSILRSDYDQFKRKIVQEKLGLVDPDYYTFETHVFFDDAMTAYGDDEHDYTINDFVALLVECIDQAASSVHDTLIHIEQPEKYPTPYGGRLVWKLPGENVLIAHLKDKEKIRHKKRWSQVMYMYYLLGHRLWNKIKRWEPDKAQKMADNTYLLALDGDVDFRPKAVRMLVDLMRKDEKVGAACGRIHPIGTGPMVWYQKFEYALGHWMQKATEHVLGCVLCSPGCFSLFRGSALMDENVMRTYTTVPTEPIHHVQYDQGEDRWLCTLLLQQGHRVEYSAASDAYTYAPEGFNEFYNQRRRWMPSTMANIMDLLMTWKRTIDVNENISLLYIAYQTILLLSSILGTGTIFLMIVGSLSLVLKLDSSNSEIIPFIINLVPLIIFMLVCYLAKADTQLFLAAILTTIYSLLQMLVLVGIVIQISEDGVGSPNAIFFFFVAGTFILAAILHPQEALCVVHGFIYFLAIPSMYMLLMMYALTNLHVISWGTREVKQTKTEKQLEEERKALAEAKKAKTSGSSLLRLGQYAKNEEGFTMAIGDLWRCICCPTRKEDREKQEYRQLLKQMERMEASFDVVSHKVDTMKYGEATEDEETYAGHENWELGQGRPSGRLGPQISYSGTRNQSINPMFDENAPDNEPPAKSNPMYDDHPPEVHNEPEEPATVNQPKETIKRDELKNPKWIEDDRLGDGPIKFLPEKESRFFTELIQKYLKPLLKNKVEEEKVQMALLELRNKMSGTYFLLNAIFVVVVFTLQMNVDKVSIPWPIGDGLKLEPIGFMFLIFFAIIMLVQIGGMVAHRATTFLHIIATTKLPCERADSGGTAEMEQHLATLQKEIDRTHASSVGRMVLRATSNSQDNTPEVTRRIDPKNRRGTLYKLKARETMKKAEAKSSGDISNQLRDKLERLTKELDEHENVATIRLGKRNATITERRKSIAALKYFQTIRKKTAVQRSQSQITTSRDRARVSALRDLSLSPFTPTEKVAGDEVLSSDNDDIALEMGVPAASRRDTPAELTPSSCRSEFVSIASGGETDESIYDTADPYSARHTPADSLSVNDYSEPPTTPSILRPRRGISCDLNSANKQESDSLPMNEYGEPPPTPSILRPRRGISCDVNNANKQDSDSLPMNEYGEPPPTPSILRPRRGISRDPNSPNKRDSGASQVVFDFNPPEVKTFRTSRF